MPEKANTIKKESCPLLLRWKKLSGPLAFLLLLGAVFVSFSGLPVSAQTVGWYCKTSEGGKQPPLPPEFSFFQGEDAIWLGPETEKVIYLTFDAGYVNENVLTILDVLKRHGAEGAFFVLEHTVSSRPEVLRRMKEEGHLICNHTATHLNTASAAPEQTEAELKRLEDAVVLATGEKPDPFFRPPEGSFTEETVNTASRCGYATVLWSYAYADWDNSRQPEPVKSADRILSHTHPGMVLLLHPTSATNAAILDDLLTEWERMGYRFGSLYEFL